MMPIPIMSLLRRGRPALRGDPSIRARRTSPLPQDSLMMDSPRASVYRSHRNMERPAM
jgi:hypothetical protein